SFRSILPTWSNYGPKTTPPIVTLTPNNGIIPSRSQFRVMITAYVPTHNNTVGDSWMGPVQFIQVTNSTNPGGAVLEAGLLKVLTVTATPPIFSIVPYAIAVVVIAVIVVVAY